MTTLNRGSVRFLGVLLMFSSLSSCLDEDDTSRSLGNPPLAKAGAPQTRFVGETVQLDGTASADVDGDQLEFEWSFVSQPTESKATLSAANSVSPTFRVDEPGAYELALVVHDGERTSLPDVVVITTQNSVPVADAGHDQRAELGDTVRLDATASSDADGDRLSFDWSLVSTPKGSQATLSDSSAMQPIFKVDEPGTYVAELIVTDAISASKVATVSVTRENLLPRSDAGPNQRVVPGETVVLDGSGSVDHDGDPLSYRWSLTAVPQGTGATLSDPTAQRPLFTFDGLGTYVAQLIVNDGYSDSEPTTVVVSTENLPPVSYAGSNWVVSAGDVVRLDGSRSYDPDGRPLGFRWALTAAPAGSEARLWGADSITPTLPPDLPGAYLVQLITNDGVRDSQPATAVIQAMAPVGTVPEPWQPEPAGSIAQVTNIGQPAATPLTSTVSNAGRAVRGFDPAADDDADGVTNGMDNCVDVGNPNQRDSDDDGFGNRCDPDLDNDGVVNFGDLQLMKADFFASGDLASDLDGDGMVNFTDLSILKDYFFGPPGPTGLDVDGDTVLAEDDNCYLVNNPDQRDTNGDGFGNWCDADLDNNGSVNFADLAILKEAFFSTPEDPNWNPDADFNGDDAVNFIDLNILKESFFGNPGPSGLLPPTIRPIADRSVSPGNTLSINIDAINPNQTPLTYSATPLPDNATIDSVTGSFAFTPDETQLNTTYLITFAATDGVLTGERLVRIDVKRVGIASLSPTDGEEMVSVTREVVVRFDGRVDPTTLTDQSLFLLASGQTIPGNIAVSSSNEFVTFFPDDDMPSSTNIRIVVDGDLITDEDGILLDADGDGMPGGTLTADFQTLPMTRIPKTDVWGYVFDSQSNSMGSAIPLEGVRLEVEGLPELVAVTDANGYFILEDTPAPVFFVKIDARNVAAPPGMHYGDVRKPFHSVAGHSQQIAVNGVPFNIYMPLIIESDTVDVVAGQSTSAGFGAASLDNLVDLFPNIGPAMWELLQVNIPADTIFFDDGSPATGVTVIPMTPESIPVPIPEGISTSMVFTVEAGGATNVDGFAQLVYPNVDGLPPGETVSIWAFDHDTGKWITTGTMTVSVDGSVLVSNESNGVRTLGWRFVAAEPATETEGGCDPQIFSADNLFSVFRAVKGCVTGLSSRARGWLAAIQVFVNSTLDVISITRDLLDQVDRGEDPDVLFATFQFLNGRKGDMVTTFDAFKDSSPKGAICAGIDCASSIISGLSDICGRVENSDGCNTFVVRTVCTGLDVSSTVLTTTQQLKDIVDGALDDAALSIVCSLLDEVEALFSAEPLWTRGTFPYDELAAILNDVETEAMSLLTDANGIDEFTDAFIEFSDSLDTLSPIVDFVNDSHIVPVGAYFVYQVLGLEVRGRTTEPGEYPGSFPPDTDFQLIAYDPETDRVATYAGRSGAGGQETSIPQLIYEPAQGMTDTDGDRLVDQAEIAVGTSILDPDTDSDGIGDFDEVVQGLDPLDDRGFPTGIIASLSLAGETEEIVVEGSVSNSEEQTAYVATGSHGLAIVDSSSFSNPIVLGQLDLSGTATDVAIDERLRLVAVAGGDAGIHSVNVSDPVAPVLIDTIVSVGAVSRLESADGLIYAASGTKVVIVDWITGDRLLDLALSAEVNDLARESQMLYAVTADDRLHVLEIVGSSLAPRGSVDLPSAASRVFTGDAFDPVSGQIVKVAYIANGIENTSISIPNPELRGGYVTVNVSDPDNPILISGIDTPEEQAGNLKTITNGSGIALVAGGFRGLQLHGASDPANTYELITEIATPGIAKSVHVAGGIAFVADDDKGLQVINYLSFDALGVAPEVLVDTAAIDLDPALPGIQVQEGSNIWIPATISDDVFDQDNRGQVRNAELLVDGQVVRNDVSFPFDFAVEVPALAAGASTVTVEIRAADTGGNIGSSGPFDLELVPDTFPPQIVNQTPADGDFVAAELLAVRIDFSEPMDEATLSDLTLVLRASDGTIQSPFDQQIRALGESIQLTYLVPNGEYEFSIDTAAILDRAGHPLGGEIQTRYFTFYEFEATVQWSNPDGGDWSDPGNWSSGMVPGPNDQVFVDLPPGAFITHSSGTTVVRDIFINGGLRLQHSVLDVAGFLSVTDTFLIDQNGTIRNATIEGPAIEATGHFIVLDSVTLRGNMQIRRGYDVTVLNGLVLQGSIGLNGSSATQFSSRLSFSGTQTLSGTGDLVFPTSALGGNVIRPTDGGTLTIGPSITIHGHTGTVGHETLPLINHGLISTVGGYVVITGNAWSSSGLLRAEGGGILSLQGAVDNAGQTLNLDGAGGSIELRAVTVRNTQIPDIGGTTLGAVGAVTLDAVMLGADLSLNIGDNVKVLNGLNLESIITLRGTSTNNPVRLEFSGSQMLSGTGEILFDAQLVAAGTGFVRPSDGGALTIGPNITIRGNAGTVGDPALPIVNGGVIAADGGGTLVITGNAWSSSGLLMADGGGTMSLSGTLDNGGAVLNIDGANGAVNLNGVTVRAAQITGTPGTVLTVSADATFDNVSLLSDLVLGTNDVLTVLNGLVLEGVITLNSSTSGSSAAELNFSGTQTLSGGGELLIAAPTGCTVCNVVRPTDDGTLTIGPNITVHGNRGIIGDAALALINQGLISSDVSGGSLLVQGAIVIQDQGIIAALGGGDITVNGLGTNEGTLRVGAGSVLATTGKLTLPPTSVVEVSIGGTNSGEFGRLNVGGTTNFGGALSIDRINGFMPVLGQEFQIMTYDSRAGEFKSINGADIGDGLIFGLTYNPGALVMSVDAQ